MIAAMQLRVRRRTLSVAFIPLLAALSVLAAAVAPAPAGAAPVTVGSPLVGPFTPGAIPISATLANLPLIEPGAATVAPIAGTIVRWRTVAASGGPFALKVLRPLAGGLFRSVGSSAPVLPGAPLEVHAAAIPVQAGDLIALDIHEGRIGVLPVAAPAGIAIWLPPLADGENRAPLGSEAFEVAFNADLQPPPRVAAISPSSGTFKGGTRVTIAGSDFAAVSAVSFAGQPAASFSVDSEAQITAVAPPAAAGSTADITVTTVAGTSVASAADHFTAKACVVPKLNGKRFKAVKKKLRRAGCGIGLILRKGGISLKAGRVEKQGPKPGTKLAPGAKVRVTLS